MSVILMSLLLLAGGDESARTVSPCDDFRTIPVGTEVVVEGRYFSDFMHGEALQADDCQVHVALHSRAGEGPLANKFLNATWRRRPFPTGDSSGVSIRMRGVVAMEERGHLGLPGQPIILASELLNVSVQEDHDR